MGSKESAAGLELGVIVPAFNAQDVLPRTLERLAAAASAGLIVILVDDGSRDATSGVARQAASAHGLALEILRHPVNRGYGAAQKTGLRRSLELGCCAHVLLHADGQYEPAELPKLIGPLREGRAEVVFGSRIISGRALREGMPWLRYAGNRLITFVENAVFGLSFAEYHAGYMAYSSQALRAIAFETLTNGFHFDGEMLMCAGKLGLAVSEVPITTHYGPESTSLEPLPYVWEIVGILARYLRGGYFFQQRTCPGRGL